MAHLVAISYTRIIVIFNHLSRIDVTMTVLLGVMRAVKEKRMSGDVERVEVYVATLVTAASHMKSTHAITINHYHLPPSIHPSIHPSIYLSID